MSHCMLEAVTCRLGPKMSLCAAWALCGVLALVPVGLGQQAPVEGAFELAPGVVVDPSAGQLYRMLPEGGLDALSIDDGQVQWATQRAAKPLIVSAGELLAQVDRRDELEVVLFDSSSGRETGSLSVPLPDSVVPGIDDTMNRRFVARASLRGGVPYVETEFLERPAQGIVPPAGTPPLAPTTSAARVDVVQRTAVQVPQSVVSRVVAPPAFAQVSLRGNGERQILGNAAVQSVVMVEDERRTLRLRRWTVQPSSLLTDVVVHQGEFVVHWPSADLRHFLVSERVAPGDLQEYEWSIYDAATGVLVGQLRHQQSQADFFVSGDRIVFEGRPYIRRTDQGLFEWPRRLEARVLGSGTLVWEAPVRETSYRGEVPP